ncbi:PAS domain-containing protein [Bradyrhizobium sp. USDA 4471]
MLGGPFDRMNAAWLEGGGEMGARVRAHDWSKAEIGSPHEWPRCLQAAVSICLGSRYLIVLWWGRHEYTQFYNDAYISFLGATKHPKFLGESGRECWREIWPVVGPMVDSVFESGEPTWSEDLLLILDRKLPREEGYFTFSYGPIRDEDGSVGGIFCTCYETTGRVVGERRLKTLRDLGRTELKTSVGAACEAAAGTFAENQADIPFSLIYLNEGSSARLTMATGLRMDHPAAPASIALTSLSDTEQTWPLRTVFESGSAELGRVPINPAA